MMVASGLGERAGEWNALAGRAGNPFLTVEWLTCWWEAFGRGDPLWVLSVNEDGTLDGGAMVYRDAPRALSSAANVHSPAWDVLGVDDAARARVCQAIGGLGAGRIRLHALPDPSGTGMRTGLEQAGYRVASVASESPWLALPGDWDDLLAGVSRGLRSQVGRRRRTLERMGILELRITSGGPELDRDLERFLALEAAGWKGEQGTAILCRADTRRFYSLFARAAAARGWLRLYSLELDGRLIAADYGLAFGDEAFLVKTAFSEPDGRLSPGLVLRAAVLRSSIEAGLRGYNFLGGADTYKARWSSEMHRLTSLWAYRGPYAPGYVYRRQLRPMLKRVRYRASAMQG